MWMPCSSSSHLWITEAFCSVQREKSPAPLVARHKCFFVFFRFKLSVCDLLFLMVLSAWFHVCTLMCEPLCHEDSSLENWMVVSKPCSSHTTTLMLLAVMSLISCHSRNTIVLKTDIFPTVSTPGFRAWLQKQLFLLVVFSHSDETLRCQLCVFEISLKKDKKLFSFF